MSSRLRRTRVLLLIVGVWGVAWASAISLAAAVDVRPNIVLVLADDMGYGDPGCYNPDSKCLTPRIDKLASQGMRFTDAHSAGALCIPSRYGLLTGRYPFRAVLNVNQTAGIEEGRPTLASFLRSQGYSTHMVGKWHLGLEGGPQYDYSQPLRGGPVDRGFDTCFSEYASLDIPPYFYIRGNRVTHAPTNFIEAGASADWSPIQGAFWRAGAISPDFKHDEVLDRWGTEAVAVLESLQGSATPFFLYVPLTGPHTPWLPAAKFKGSGQAGLYGEFVAHVDDVVGRVLDAVESQGFTDNTLVIFASDNGPTWYDADEEKFGHHSAGPLRGMKADAWEGGHRIPFIVRWPGQVEPGSVSTQLIGFTDLFATFAEMLQSPLPDGAAEDSVSFLSALRRQPSAELRSTLVVHHEGTAIREGDWKLITHLGSGGFTPPKRIPVKPGDPNGQLYNLAEDLAEQHNLWQSRPDVVERLSVRLKQLTGR